MPERWYEPAAAVPPTPVTSVGGRYLPMNVTPPSETGAKVTWKLSGASAPSFSPGNDSRARRLAAEGAKVVVADILDDLGKAVADDLGEAARYVAIITDGNGRWARDRGLPVLAGHQAGADVVKARLRDAVELGVEELTLVTEGAAVSTTRLSFALSEPGVPGIGEKGAKSLIQEYGSLEGVLENVDKISGAKKVECSPSNTGSNLTDYADDGYYFRTAPPGPLTPVVGGCLSSRVIGPGAPGRRRNPGRARHPQCVREPAG